MAGCVVSPVMTKMLLTLRLAKASVRQTVGLAFSLCVEAHQHQGCTHLRPQTAASFETTLQSHTSMKDRKVVLNVSYMFLSDVWGILDWQHFLTPRRILPPGWLNGESQESTPWPLTLWCCVFAPRRTRWIHTSSLSFWNLQLDAMMQVLRRSDEVEQLVLRNTDLTDDLLLSLAGALKSSPSEVTLLNLNLNLIGPYGAHILLDVLRAKPQVKGLQ